MCGSLRYMPFARGTISSFVGVRRARAVLDQGPNRGPK